MKIVKKMVLSLNQLLGGLQNVRLHKVLLLGYNYKKRGKDKINEIIGHLVRGNGVLLRHKITDTVTPEKVQSVWNYLTDMSNATRLNSIEVIN